MGLLGALFGGKNNREPSWSKNEAMQIKFAAGVQSMAGNLLSGDALVAMFSLEKTLSDALAIAAEVERKGGSFKDQQLAVKNFMVRSWNELSPETQKSIEDGFAVYR